MQDLIERLEKAEASSFELDEAIWCALNPGYDPTTYNGDPRWRPYTGSIDAALTLLPYPHWDHLVAFKCGIGWYAFIKAPDLTIWESSFDRKSGAIALCVAAVKARAALIADHRDKDIS